MFPEIFFILFLLVGIIVFSTIVKSLLGSSNNNSISYSKYNYLYTDYSEFHKYLIDPDLKSTSNIFVFSKNELSINTSRLYKFFDKDNNYYLVDPKAKIINGDKVVIKDSITKKYHLSKYINDTYYPMINKENISFKTNEIEIIGVVIFNKF